MKITTKKVDVYFNLHKKKLSVRSREHPNYRKVIAHKDSVLMTDCTFVVSETGRQRVLRERRKNVHAVVRGNWVKEADWGGRNSFLSNVALDYWKLVKYNPYTRAVFWTVEDNEPIHKARFVIINGKDMLAIV